MSEPDPTRLSDRPETIERRVTTEPDFDGLANTVALDFYEQ